MSLKWQIPQAQQIKSSRTKQPIYFWSHGFPLICTVETTNEDKQEPVWAISFKRETVKISVKESHGIPTAQRNCQVAWDRKRKEELGRVESFSTQQPHFSGMCQEGTDKEISKHFGPSNEECVNVRRPEGSNRALTNGGELFTQYSRAASLGVALVRLLRGKG